MIGRADIEGVLRADGRDTIVDIWVIPGARRSEVVGLHDGALRVRVAAPPEGGKANRALLALLADIIDVEPVLEHGESSRRKRVRLPDRAASMVARTLAAYLARRR